MKYFLLIVIAFLSTFCFGQNLNLVPSDSSNFMIIADTLFDTHQFISDSSLIIYDKEINKTCPCIVENSNGIVTYKSGSFSIKNNRCLYLYESDSNYIIRVGQMTSNKDSEEKYRWYFKTNIIEEKVATKLINDIKDEIKKAKVPVFETLMIVHDAPSYTFGDLQNNSFATTPITGYSNSVKKLIKFSNQIISKNLY
jgi:hypothetical protein